MADIEKVIKDNAIRGLQSAIEISGALVHLRKEHAEALLALLKEQEAVVPITEHHLFLCPVCKNTLFREQKFCHECGKRIEWEGR